MSAVPCKKEVPIPMEITCACKLATKHCNVVYINAMIFVILDSANHVECILETLFSVHVELQK